MYFLLFGFWVLLNGKWNAEIALVGAIVCAALYAFMMAFMGYSPKREWQLFKRIPRIIGYFIFLVKEIFLSSWQTMKLIWSPEKEIEPRVTSFRTRLRTDAGKVVLANSITMTPGTITVDVQDDLFLIHCLDESFDMGAEGFEMEDRISRLEGKKPASPAKKEEAQDE
ncbi:MAG: Na+/H+ antiporter subunit E [Aristaeellaceae bacterium]